MRNLEYFLSDEFAMQEEVPIEDIWALSCLIPDNEFTGQTFEDMFVLVSDDGEYWLNWNGKIKRVISNVNDINFF